MPKARAMGSIDRSPGSSTARVRVRPRRARAARATPPGRSPSPARLRGVSPPPGSAERRGDRLAREGMPGGVAVPQVRAGHLPRGAAERPRPVVGGERPEIGHPGPQVDGEGRRDRQRSGRVLGPSPRPPRRRCPSPTGHRGIPRRSAARTPRRPCRAPSPGRAPARACPAALRPRRGDRRARRRAGPAGASARDRRGRVAQVEREHEIRSGPLHPHATGPYHWTAPRHSVKAPPRKETS